MVLELFSNCFLPGCHIFLAHRPRLWFKLWLCSSTLSPTEPDPGEEPWKSLLLISSPGDSSDDQITWCHFNCVVNQLTEWTVDFVLKVFFKFFESLWSECSVTLFTCILVSQAVPHSPQISISESHFQIKYFSHIYINEYVHMQFPCITLLYTSWLYK